MTRRAALAFVLISLLWGSAWIPTSEIVKQVPALRAGALRFGMAALSAALFVPLLPGKVGARFSFALFRDAFILSITALAVPYALTASVSPHISTAVIPVLFAFMPLIALLMSREVRSDAIPALVIGISGVVLLVAPALSFSIEKLGGALLILCAVILGAFSLIYAKRCLRGSDLLLSSSIQFAFATLVLGTLSFATERTHPGSLNAAVIPWFLVLGFAVSGVTLPLLYWLLTKVEPWQAGLLQWISTLVAVAEAAWLLHARPSSGQAIGAACIIACTFWLLTRREGVTSAATSYAIEGPAASQSEVGSKYR
jgi:drug/metabolite transporter (DMT)-like permease